MLQNNLGNALQYVSSSHTVENNLRALDAYDEALKVRTRETSPLEYANTISNKANCLWNLPDDPEHPEAGNRANLTQANAYYPRRAKSSWSMANSRKRASSPKPSTRPSARYCRLPATNGHGARRAGNREPVTEGAFETMAPRSHRRLFLPSSSASWPRSPAAPSAALSVGGKALGNELAAMMGGFFGPLAGIAGMVVGLVALAIIG